MLVDCETQLSAQSNWEFVHPRNLVARWHLAGLLRQTGKVTDAEAIEDALRGQLRLADPDHPIARALKQLPPTNNQTAIRNRAVDVFPSANRSGSVAPSLFCELGLEIVVLAPFRM